MSSAYTAHRYSYIKDYDCVKFMEHKCIGLGIIGDVQINPTLALSSRSLKSSGEDTNDVCTDNYSRRKRRSRGRERPRQHCRSPEQGETAGTWQVQEQPSLWWRRHLKAGQGLPLREQDVPMRGSITKGPAAGGGACPGTLGGHFGRNTGPIGAQRSIICGKRLCRSFLGCRNNLPQTGGLR